MTDDVQREIEENQRRARDEQDVGLDEDHINQRDGTGNFVTDAADAIFNPDEQRPREDDHEFEDNTKSNG